MTERVRVKMANFDSPEDVRIIEDLVARFRWLLPFWLRQLRIERHTGDGDSAASRVSSNRSYHGAYIELMHNFYDADPMNRTRFFVHELIHTHLNTLGDWMVNRVIDPIKERNEELHCHLASEFRVRFEEAVDGLARAVLDHEIEIKDEEELDNRGEDGP